MYNKKARNYFRVQRICTVGLFTADIIQIKIQQIAMIVTALLQGKSGS